ncbi:NAD(P)/FAD-dependent oxidoreductase [Stieleria sp. TO1_6]|uniref:dihydrolipoyl dehydrogenase family protein n=1 Tax=Stieleria tagensis TaxID=2956795 RepID=UPI00209A79E9|nr:NAD(P)/FAD-dependent oxidoreductase [Stieleria tagensis]MCO8123199.1 NAD(P)/FAD-dependent oxidoreductase [Stieleria tagensis]
MSNYQFDLIVIGTGPAASTVAKKCADDGKRVAIIESREFGGTCALRGCNPKKVYSNAGDLIDRVRGANGKLIESADAHLNWQALSDFKNQFTKSVPEIAEKSFKKRGIETFHGAGVFTGPNTVRVGEQELTGERIFIGVGARPRPLEIPGAENAILSDQFLELSEIPKQIVFIGGGYISMEFACVAARYGSNVTVLQRGDSVLKQFDRDLVAQLTEYSANHGLIIHTESDVKAIEMSDDLSMVVRYQTSGNPASLEARLVVHGAGRVPNLHGMNLEAGEVTYGKKGIEVDAFMRSVSNANVFAGGDCANSGKPALTPTANEEARIVVKNLFAEKPEHKPDYGIIPQVAFTVPVIASIGMSQVEAEQSHDVDVRYKDTSSWNSVRKSGQRCAGYKVLIDKNTDQILGAHLLGPAAEETINLFALAMKHGLTATDMKSTLFAYPTFGADVRLMI